MRKVSTRQLMMFGLMGFGVLCISMFIVHFGLGAIVGPIQRLGPAGFVAFCLYTLGVLSLLGVSWYVLAAGTPLRQLRGFIVGRVMREVGADVLPFAQLGGFLLGVRGACLFGVSTSLSIGSSIVDLGAEMIGQLLFTAIGLVILSLHPPAAFPHRALDPVLAFGFLIGIATVWAFFASQRFASSVLIKFSARWSVQMREHLSSVQIIMANIYARPAWVALSIGLHLVAWLVAAGGVCMVLRFMGVHLHLSAVLVMESLVYLLRSMAFFVPGAIGVLEGGYVLLGPIFGLPAEIALSLALIKRGRDCSIGLLALGAWQIVEGRRLLRPGPTVLTRAENPALHQGLCPRRDFRSSE